VLGYPPGGYKSSQYRARAVREPRAVLAEFGTVLPEGVALRVVDSTADYRWMVLPLRPAGTEGWSAERLAGLVTPESLVGVRAPRSP
jgi:nitrile hydratase